MISQKNYKEILLYSNLSQDHLDQALLDNLLTRKRRVPVSLKRCPFNLSLESNVLSNNSCKSQFSCNNITFELRLCYTKIIFMSHFLSFWMTLFCYFASFTLLRYLTILLCSATISMYWSVYQYLEKYHLRIYFPGYFYTFWTLTTDSNKMWEQFRCFLRPFCTLWIKYCWPSFVLALYSSWKETFVVQFL